MYYGGNNHGSIVQIRKDWYIFYHRHTNGQNFGRQGCIEKIRFDKNGKIPQVMMTSCGANKGPLKGSGIYPAYLACSLYCLDEATMVGGPGEWMDCRFPKITQDQPDGVEGMGYIANMCSGATAGFKFFDCKNVTGIAVRTRGDANGCFVVRTAWDGAPLGVIPLGRNNEWKTYRAPIQIPDGIQALYFTFEGSGRMSFSEFELITGGSGVEK